MKAVEKRFLKGKHTLSGFEACAEGALSAGCGFLGYFVVATVGWESWRFVGGLASAGD